MKGEDDIITDTSHTDPYYYSRTTLSYFQINYKYNNDKTYLILRIHKYIIKPPATRTITPATPAPAKSAIFREVFSGVVSKYIYAYVKLYMYFSYQMISGLI